MVKSFYDSPLDGVWVWVKKYYAMNYSYFEMDYHKHNEMEIMYAVHGSCRVDVISHSGEEQVYQLKQGEYIFLDGGVSHRLAMERGITCRVLNLEMGRIEGKGMFSLGYFAKSSQTLKGFLDRAETAIKQKDQNGQIHMLIVALQRQLECDLDQQEDHLEANLLLSQLLVEMARHRLSVSGPEGRCRYVRQATAYLKIHFEHELKVEDVAKAIGISTAHLQRIFKEETGISLWDKLIELRLEKAKLLLEISSLSVIDVAVSVGFQNRQHFCKTFNKQVGCPPGTYRKFKGNMQRSLDL